MRSVENRLRKLESNLTQPEQPAIEGLATVAHVLPRERKENLVASERVVIDWYRIVSGVIWGRERLSNDPADRGRCCERNGYLVDVIQELHQACSYRERPGWCATCQGTPIADCQPQ
jgi:hypothetical protein